MDPECFKREYRPANRFDDDDITKQYWEENGDIYYREEMKIRGADKESFVFFLGSFAKDKNNCYLQDTRLKDSSPNQFRALNNCFCKDDKSVWCIGGKIKEADAESFEVCDDGIHKLRNLYVPYGYAKDKYKVFYYDFSGKACWVRKANPSTFRSRNDGHFGYDDTSVFCGRSQLKSAKVEDWCLIDGYYSRDSKRVYYLNRQVSGVDFDTFEVHLTKKNGFQFAKDKGNFYRNDVIISEQQYQESQARY